jgi:hypothetical protein
MLQDHVALESRRGDSILASCSFWSCAGMLVFLGEHLQALLPSIFCLHKSVSVFFLSSELPGSREKTVHQENQEAGCQLHCKLDDSLVYHLENEHSF